MDYQIKVSASADTDKVLDYLLEKKVALENSDIFRGYSLTDNYLKDHGNYFLRSGKYVVCAMRPLISYVLVIVLF